jgi:hypothetical protein
VFQNNGVIPWTDLPFDSMITQDTYLTGITPDMTAKAKQFLAAIGGKSAIAYHWVIINPPNLSGVVSAMQQALPQAPLCLGTPADVPGWNQVEPLIPDNSNPNHSTLNYLITSTVDILDHYVPFFKELPLAYPIPQVMQGIVMINEPIVVAQPVPTLPNNPTTQEDISWLNQVLIWLQNLGNSLVGAIKGRNQNIKGMSNLFSLAYQDWLKGFLVAVIGAVLTALEQVLNSSGFSGISWQHIALVGITAGIAYLIKQFFTDSNGVAFGIKATAKPSVNTQPLG